MIRKSFVMTLHPGQSALYEERHNPIWPELEQVLKDHGVYQYSVFLHPDQRSLSLTQRSRPWNNGKPLPRRRFAKDGGNPCNRSCNVIRTGALKPPT